MALEVCYNVVMDWDYSIKRKERTMKNFTFYVLAVMLDLAVVASVFVM